MKTDIHSKYLETEWISEADDILRSCVHCGFCTATCPTYQELGDERDGPRGRIYLIKQFLEEGSATSRTVKHLDRCLTCRACETTCPSGVEYGRLVDLGRHAIDQEVTRSLLDRVMRWALLRILPYRRRFGFLLSIGQLLRPILPAILRNKIPARQHPEPWPGNKHDRLMLAMNGCAQAAATPNTNVSTARVLARLGVSLVSPKGDGCCGAASYHLSAHDEAIQHARRNIDAWWPYVERGVESIVITASGCGSMVKDYGKLLGNDKDYADKARVISGLARDISEVLDSEDLSVLDPVEIPERVAVHCPCSLQHGQQLPDVVENILTELGLKTTQTDEKLLCCGSAGTYSILQPTLSNRLLDRKIEALMIDGPDEIVTANVGCQMHLASKSEISVRHWIEIVDEITSR
ncbi:glycolate oxidase subunit GlcF [Pseudohalioglobus lutimaris]|uniref:Glycolate oxidase iron-sulfur subunit n=1 Tax=Pseudohalioglobus lutimaris TaxID=1737061 RepID=A0A2N5X049_9GAMM|nr:glycolate oxidase subunit GlcF [Pseudohalioglobus lutimaris]PLW67826.1 glycolate oxidase iron-sulfur subunit [Pseudohalioglobus lutimaris]